MPLRSADRPVSCSRWWSTSCRTRSTPPRRASRPGPTSHPGGRAEGKICIRFHDNGPGFRPEQLDRVFDPLCTRKPVGKRTGLGLSISYGIVEHHHGELRAVNHPDGGAVLTLTQAPEPGESPQVRDGCSATRPRLPADSGRFRVSGVTCASVTRCPIVGLPDLAAARTAQSWRPVVCHRSATRVTCVAELEIQPLLEWKGGPVDRPCCSTILAWRCRV
jgi:hypothetical protein